MSTNVINNENKNDDYNFKSLNRKDLIMNRNLDSSDFPIRKFKQLDTKRDFSLNNYVLDIKGAFPRRYGFYSKKKDFTNTNLDIEKSYPINEYNKYTNKPDYIYKNDDIEKSKPQGHHVFQNNRHVNPLNPVYQLPSCDNNNYSDDESSYKFIRDTLDIKDIEGTRPKKSYYETIIEKNNKNNNNIVPRDNINKFNDKIDNDILIEHKKNFHNNRNKLYNSLDYRDVYKKTFDLNTYESKRNPLDPTYSVSYLNGEKYILGEIDGSKPKVFSRYNTEKDGKNLTTKDIEGAEPDSISFLQKYYLRNKKPLMYSAEDIIGAKHDTRVRGIVTKRNLNPLVPKYMYLGAIEEKEENARNKRYEINKTEDNYKSYITNNVNDICNNSLNKSLNEKKDNVDVNINKNIENNINDNKNIENNINDNNNINNNNNEKKDEMSLEKLKTLPYYEDEVKFNKDDYKRPEIYRPKPHDEAIIGTHPNKQARVDYLQNCIDRERKYKSPQEKNLKYQKLNDNKLSKENHYNPYAYQLSNFIHKNT